MSLSDCAKCWETPCECGHQYRSWPTDRLVKMRDMFDALILAQTSETNLPLDLHLLEPCREIFLELVSQASERMGNNGCNDFDLSPYLKTPEKINALVEEYHRWNGDRQEFDSKRDNKMALPDFALFSFLADKLVR